jgi:DNA-binding CsgD family transcriptional regulator
MLLTYERPDSWLFKVAIRKLHRLEAKARERFVLNGDLSSNEANLPRRQSEVAALKWLEGCTLKETAEILGISVAAVKMYLIEARKSLLVLLQVDQGPPDAMGKAPP